ncbi:MAG: amidase [Acidimicrobiia bacterium]|nr:amidase [Acidimicrobiia bacterium]
MVGELRFLEIHELAAALRAGEVTSVQLTQEYQAAADRLDPELGTYIARFDEAALAAAARADAELAEGRDRGLLHGIPLGVKDIIATEEGPTTAQSLVLDPGWGPGGDAPVVARLREAGAIVLGKTTTMEFAIGAPDRSKPFPVPKNPWDTGHWTGGSSSGTGNGVAAGLFPAGLGSDTGGSIRLPAAYNGVSGHKPTYGLVPKSGVVPLGFTYDHVGPLARSARDCAVLLDVLAGPDPADPTTVDAPAWRRGAGDVAAVDGPGGDGLAVLAGLRVGVARAATVEGGACEAGVAACFDAALGVLAQAGAELVDVAFPLWDELHDACFLGLFAEAFAWHRATLAQRWADYGYDTRMTIALGGLVSAGDYVQAQRVRSRGQVEVRALLEQVDVVLTPTTGTVAPAFGERAMGREQRLRALFSPPFNSLGLPALSVPMGFDGGLPTGLQIAGAAFADDLVLRVGAAYQQLTDWHRRLPELSVAPVS